MKNGKPIDWAARLQRLEADVLEIKDLLKGRQQSKAPWWESVVGIYANDPAAEEVRRIVEANREKERRKARRARPRKKAQSAGE